MPTPLQQKLASIALFTAILSLILVAAAAWTFLSTQEQVQQLQQEVRAMQRDMQFARNLQPEWVQMQERLHEIESTIQKLETRPEPKEPEPVIHAITPATPAQALKQVQVKPVEQAKAKVSPSWLVVIASFDSLSKAKKAQNSRKIRDLGTSITRVQLKHGVWYRIVKSGFADKAAAKAFAAKLKTLGFRDAWIQYYKPKH